LLAFIAVVISEEDALLLRFPLEILTGLGYLRPTDSAFALFEVYDLRDEWRDLEVCLAFTKLEGVVSC
jgi:hypothetical protein